MPRRLSNPEWVQFQEDINLNTLGLPPWGAVVQWGSQYILVFICQGTGFLCQQGEAMLTDVSDRADLLHNVPNTYDYTQGVWIYHVPQEGIARFYEVAKSTLQATGKVIDTIAEEAGKAAGAATGPLLGNLTIPLIALAVIAVIAYTPKR